MSAFPYGLTTRFLNAVANDHKAVIKAEVHTASGLLLRDISTLITAGSVTTDESREIRRTCTLTVQGTTALVPAPFTAVTDANALFHPASGNEIWLWRGVQYPDGTTEFAQLGVFRMTKPTINDDGKTITITINGQDRASVVARLAWQRPYTIPAGANMGGAIFQALQFLLGGIYTNLNASGILNNSFTYPNTTFGADPSSGSDPMQDLITFAATAGCELFFDVTGQPVLRNIINPLGAAVVDAASFVEGVNCTMVGGGRTLDEGTAYNGVIVFCNGASATCAPFSQAVWDTRPASPTYYNGPWGQVPFIITTTTIPAPGDTYTGSAGPPVVPSAQAKAFNMAVKQLQLLLGSFDAVNISTVPNPAFREGDCVAVARSRIKIASNYVISSMTIPLDVESPQTINFRPQIQAA